MMHEKFHYKSVDDICVRAKELGVELPMTHDLSILTKSIEVGGSTFENRMAVHPMEGSDSELDGTPSDLTLRRYERFVSGGAALIWFESTSIAMEGRSGAHQLYFDEKTMPAFTKLVEQMKEAGIRENGFAPKVILQLNHSGRYSKSMSSPSPLIAYHKPIAEKDALLPESCVVTDDYIDRLVEAFGDASLLAEKAGFDGVDLKACHGYLGNELLSAYTREGKYGGSFENRTRFLMDCMKAAKAAINPDFILSLRLGIYDGLAYPYGFGVKTDGSLEPDMTEPKAILNRLRNEFGVDLINITMGIPYTNPHVNRPYDVGNYIPDEHPLEGLGRIAKLTAEVQHACPDIHMICSGVSYLREFSPNFAAALLERGDASIAGFGRMAFANPNFPKQIAAGGIDRDKVCQTCGQCAKLLRACEKTGCVIRDKEIYKILK